MSTTTSVLPIAPNRDVPGLRQSFFVRYFFVTMAVIFLSITALGFIPQLVFIHAQKIELHWFTHVHGAVMTGWLALYLGQAVLAAKGQLKYHKRLGIFSAAWGAVVWLTLGTVTISTLIRDNPPEASMQFATVALSLAAVVLFGLFFTWGIRARRDAGLHKRLVLLAMLPLMSAGIDRIGFLPALQSAYYVRFLYLDALLVPLFLYDLITLQRIHRITMYGALCLGLSQAMVVGASDSPRWQRFVYEAITPYVERRPEVSITEAQSDPLLGAYGSKDWQMVVSRESGKLFLQMPTFPKWEMGAYAEAELFLKTDKMTFAFVKDPAGSVTKVVVTEPNKTWEAARVR